MSNVDVTSSDARWGEGVRITPPRLVALTFEYDGAGEIPQPVHIQFGLELFRVDLMTLGVDFSAEVINVPDLKASTAYRIIFNLDPESPEGHEPERALQLLAARMAPVTLYPFCREALTSTAQRAGLTTFVAPITNVGALWSADEVDVPDVEGDEVETEPDQAEGVE